MVVLDASGAAFLDLDSEFAAASTDTGGLSGSISSDVALSGVFGVVPVLHLTRHRFGILLLVRDNGVFGGRFPVLLQPQYLLRPFS